MPDRRPVPAARTPRPEREVTVVDGTPVEIRRSARRHRTVSAYRDGDRVVVLLPARLSAAEEQRWVTRMLGRVDRPRRGTPRGDADLTARARALSTRYLDGRAVPRSVRWVPPMRTRWASCSPGDATIRLSRRLQEFPAWVQDYVLVHELAHLLEPGHGPAFWRLVAAYPRTERARGFLDGVSAAAQLPIADDLEGDVESAVEGAVEGDVEGAVPAEPPAEPQDGPAGR